MEARELRIGNNIRFYKNIVKCEISDLMLINRIEEDSKMYKPIKLSIKWLKDFGFEEVEPGCYENGYYTLHTPFYIYHTKQNGFSYNAHSTVIVEYVHQLQNLYFAITGEELETK